MIGGRLRFLALYQKYFLVLFLAVVIPLAASGVSEAWFGYRDQRARLHQLLGIEARSAAARIQDFIEGITNQLGWLVQLPWSDEPDERRRIDAARLLRQIPAVVSLTLMDGTGKERLYVSRIGLNRIESRPIVRAIPPSSELAGEPHLVRRGQLLPGIRALPDDRDRRQQAFGGRRRSPK